MAKKRTIKRVMAGLPAGVSSGSQLIRDQIAKGVDKPSAIVAAIKAETGVDVSIALVNNVKSTAKKKAGKLSKAPKPKAKAKAARTLGKNPGNQGRVSLGNNRGNQGRNLTDVEIAILLTEKFGAAQAREIIGVLGSEHSVG